MNVPKVQTYVYISITSGGTYVYISISHRVEPTIIHLNWKHDRKSSNDDIQHSMRIDHHQSFIDFTEFVFSLLLYQFICRLSIFKNALSINKTKAYFNLCIDPNHLV